MDRQLWRGPGNPRGRRKRVPLCAGAAASACVVRAGPGARRLLLPRRGRRPSPAPAHRCLQAPPVSCVGGRALAPTEFLRTRENTSEEGREAAGSQPRGAETPGGREARLTSTLCPRPCLAGQEGPRRGCRASAHGGVVNHQALLRVQTGVQGRGESRVLPTPARALGTVQRRPSGRNQKAKILPARRPGTGAGSCHPLCV
ncbi:PREDICTED: uncharacterized protein LOC102017348 isoform X2 [Chinchilla lanigera]|uniref:uncharacterized protein LOC102017348 isoform X2 n=1 Tax=Chinchilla lanigera TaxID=34839 RepID=UPI00038F07B0|nr:PREDICTED: uncharacterized protein LOC102017348 isoform X2 [Chinchilla lanigera]